MSTGWPLRRRSARRAGRGWSPRPCNGPRRAAAARTCVRVASIVEDQEHPAGSQQAAVEPSPASSRMGSGSGEHRALRGNRQGIGRGHGRRLIIAAKIGVELAVGEPAATRWAQYNARAVFPIPAIPVTAEMTTVSAVDPRRRGRVEARQFLATADEVRHRTAAVVQGVESAAPLLFPTTAASDALAVRRHPGGDAGCRRGG